MASLNLNKVILAGHISNDLELKQTQQSGTSVIALTIAVNGRGKPGEQPPAYFFDCKAWGKTAEFISRYFRKGSSICITGELRPDSWTDQQGQKRSKLYVNVDEAMFVDSKSDNGSNDQPAYNPYGSAAPANFEEVSGEDPDLPF